MLIEVVNRIGEREREEFRPLIRKSRIRDFESVAFDLFTIFS